MATAPSPITKDSNEKSFDVFISYTHENKKQVHQLKDRMVRAGLRCWIDEEQLKTGLSLYELIDHGIRASRVFLSCLSPAYTTSRTCRSEVALAEECQMPALIAIIRMTDPYPPIGPMGLVFAGRFYKKICEGNGSLLNLAIDELITDIKGVLTHSTEEVSEDLQRLQISPNPTNPQHTVADVTDTVATTNQSDSERISSPQPQHTTKSALGATPQRQHKEPKHSGDDLYDACVLDDKEKVRRILDEGVNINYKNENCNTSLITASSRGHTECVLMLLEAGAGVEIACNNGWTPLIRACMYGYTDCVRLLLSSSANIEHKDNFGLKALYWAQKENHTDVITLLKSHK